ncbi:MAG: thiol-activated cytolysin family protein, partial [Bacteroidota bacterium]
MELTIDLPGMRKRGRMKVADPTEGNVKVALDEALEWWNANAYEEGYKNAANSSYQTATSYSSQQLSLDLGLNYSWAKGDVAAQLNYTSNSERKITMMMFKQVFYTVSMEPHSSPAGFFGESVNLSDVQNVASENAPPAYVHSVSYGRIIMFRMETAMAATDAELTAAFNYGSGLNSASGDLAVRYNSILSNSSITSITLGGDASVASKAISYENLEEVITGENAVYSRNNPGVPIAYTIRYLKDNKFARMGFTTDYQTRECGPWGEFNHKRIRFRNTDKGTSKVRIKYRKGQQQIPYNGAWKLNIDEGEYVDIYAPDGAYDVELEVQHDDSWPIWTDYYLLKLKYIGYVESNVCYQARWSTAASDVVFGSYSCN